MHIQLAEILDQFDSARTRLHRLADGSSYPQWVERANAEQWSVEECVEHLNLTSRAYLPLIAAALEEVCSRGRAAPVRYRRDWVGWLLSLAMGPVRRLGRFRLGAVRTVPAFVPERGRPRESVMAEFDRLQAELAESVRSADGLPIGRVSVTSPFDPRLRYNLYSTFVIVARHQLRHVVQAERVWP